jgi:hypothetical protein
MFLLSSADFQLFYYIRRIEEKLYREVVLFVGTKSGAMKNSCTLLNFISA